MSARKRQQTMAKFQREQAVKEKRARKQEKKAARQRGEVADTPDVDGVTAAEEAPVTPGA